MSPTKILLIGEVRPMRMKRIDTKLRFDQGYLVLDLSNFPKTSAETLIVKNLNIFGLQKLFSMNTHPCSRPFNYYWTLNYQGG